MDLGQDEKKRGFSHHPGMRTLFLSFVHFLFVFLFIPIHSIFAHKTGCEAFDFGTKMEINRFSNDYHTFDSGLIYNRFSAQIHFRFTSDTNNFDWCSTIIYINGHCVSLCRCALACMQIWCVKMICVCVCLGLWTV